MTRDTATVRVFRFDPRVDATARYDTYEIPFDPDLSVLGMLRYVREHHDGSVAFRHGCEGSQPCKCGACVIVVNGQPGLSCQQRAERSMVVDPHWKYEVIKDLVVDFRRAKRPRDATQVARHQVALTIDADKCNGCGDCVAVCPVMVWKLAKRKAIVDDIGSCCGPDCGQCSQYCPQRAISVSNLDLV